MHALRMLDLERPCADRALQGGDDLAAGDRRPARIRPRQARTAGGGRKAQLRRSRRSATRCTICPPTSGPRSAARPTPSGEPLLSPLMELSPETVVAGLAGVSALRRPEHSRSAGTTYARSPGRAAAPHSRVLRRLSARHIDASCPKAVSPRAGIGCHFMALDDGDQTRTFTQMGGEGAPFVGMAPFTDTQHMFANIGDGTYTHSGIMAIRQAVASKTRITYKLLVNDAVAMTGGQPAEGGFTVTAIRRADRRGGRRADRHRRRRGRSPAASVRAANRRHAAHPRRTRRGAASNCASYDGVSVLIYDQVCATEKRRRRKRGKMAQPTRSVVINEQVCENCGDCSAQSELHRDRAGRDSARPQAPHQPDKLQRRSVVPERFLPELRHGGRPAAARRTPIRTGRRARPSCRRVCRCRSCPPPDALARVVRRYWRRRHRHVGRNPRDGGASGRPGGPHARFHRPGAEERHRRRACADRR